MGSTCDKLLEPEDVAVATAVGMAYSHTLHVYFMHCVCVDCWKYVYFIRHTIFIDGNHFTYLYLYLQQCVCAFIYLHKTMFIRYFLCVPDRIISSRAFIED